MQYVSPIVGFINYKNGEDATSYKLISSANVIRQLQNGIKYPGFIDFSAVYRNGQSTNSYIYEGFFVIEETVDGYTWNKVYESQKAESQVRHMLVASDGGAIGVPREISNIRCTLYDVTKTHVLDTQSVAVVKDAQALTFEEIFNILTRDGEVKGIYKEGNQLYISFTYARGGELVLGGNNNGNGVLKILNADGKQVGYVSNDGAEFVRGKIGNWNISAEYGLVDASGQITISPRKLNSHSQFSEGYTKIYGDLIQTDYMSIMKSFTCYGTKNRAIPTNEYNTVLQYCYEMPSPMFGDIGCGTVEDNGLCYVEIDPIFAETANSQIEYYVFLQKEGEGDAYVLKKTASYFVVKGTPGLKFAWELKAKQIGYELMRLETM